LKHSTAPRSPERAVARIPIQSISASPYQPRRTFSDASLEELAESIRIHGQLTPLLVRRISPERYELIAGERRLRAMNLLGRSHADAIILSLYDHDCAVVALIENLQRENQHYLDEAEACHNILTAHGVTQEKLAQSLAISASALANRLRLLKLPESVRAFLRENALSERHARALLRLRSADEQLLMAQETAARRWSVKQLETHIEQRLRAPSALQPRISGLVRDNRIVVNAVLDAVRELKRIGVRADSRVEEADGSVQVIVTIHTADPSSA